MIYRISILFLTFFIGYSGYSEESDSDNLAIAKYKMVNGDLISAEYYLNNIVSDQSFYLLSVKKRYLALIAFINGDYKKSNSILDSLPEINPESGGVNYSQICQLKLLNAIALDDTETLKKNQRICQFQTINSSKNNQYWLDTMIKLKLGNHDGVNKNLRADSQILVAKNDLTNLWIKSGLFLNKEKDFINLLSLATEDNFQSKRLNETIGFLYFRNGEPEKSLPFLENIDSANAENIKGNVNLQKNEYELAYGHFKLALQKKQDSTNALERALPLSWQLQQFEDGIPIIDNPTLKSINSKIRRGIKIGFLIRLKKFGEAENELSLLMSEYNHHYPSNINLIASYLSIILGAQKNNYDRRTSEDYSEKSCRAFDGVNCWIASKLTQWDNLGKTIKRDEQVLSNSDISIESLKNSQEIVPIKEELYVDQDDIEELDSMEVIMK